MERKCCIAYQFQPWNDYSFSYRLLALNSTFKKRHFVCVQTGTCLSILCLQLPALYQCPTQKVSFGFGMPWQFIATGNQGCLSRTKPHHPWANMVQICHSWDKLLSKGSQTLGGDLCHFTRVRLEVAELANSHRWRLSRGENTSLFSGKPLWWFGSDVLGSGCQDF